MYTIKDGILYKNGKKQIALGTSYYASYHPDKYPVPPEGDRLGQMRLDLQDIAEAGYNHIRVAAYGEARWEENTFRLDSAFIDELLRESARDGMCAFVRLHGYSMNHRGHQGTSPLNERGEACAINGFLHDTLNHPELNRDMDLATVQQARHFAAIPQVLGFQIFNEPAYSYTGGFFDYNPHTIAAYREWLVKTGRKTAAEAEALQPPTRRPCYDEDPQPWIDWRVFSAENLTAMLCRLGERAREGAPGTESFSCPMPCPMHAGALRLGEDWFGIAKGMDILGLTQYMPFRGEAYFHSQQILDGVESAAAVSGKRAWIIEFCCRTHMTAEDYERQMVAALGAGFKGINYYLWRADMDGPEMQLGGMLWNDRTKTKKFDQAVLVNRMVNRLSQELAGAEKLRSGVAILYSLQAAAYWDALEGGAEPASSRPRWYALMNLLFTQLRREGIPADFVRACDLAQNPLQTKVLFLPAREGLSGEELSQVAEFAAAHPVIELCFGEIEAGYRFHEACGESFNGFPLKQDWSYRPPKPVPRWSFRLPEALRIAGARYPVSLGADHDALAGGFLWNSEDHTCIACLVNIDSWNAPVQNGWLALDEKRLGKVQNAVCHTRDGQSKCAVRGGKILLPALAGTGGCIVLIRTEKGEGSM